MDIKEEVIPTGNEEFFNYIVQNMVQNGHIDTVKDAVLCRLCSRQVCDPVYIFGECGRKMELAKKINTCLPVTVKRTDDLPKQLCKPCIDTLETCYKFFELSLRAERDLNIIAQVTKSSLRVQEIQESNLPETTSSVTHCPLCIDGVMQEFPVVKEVHKPGDPNLLHYLENTLSDENGTKGDAVMNHMETIDMDIIIQKCKNGSDNEVIDKTIYVCRICGKCLLNVEDAYEHSKFHFTTVYFPCILCDANFRDESELEQHFEQHKMEMVEENKYPDSQIYYKCNECNQGFDSRQNYVVHLEIHGGLKQYFCELCEKEYQSETELFDHVCQFHCEPTSEVCKHCKQIVNSIDKHKCNAKEIKTYKCNTCSKNFADQNSFKAHMNDHASVLRNKYKCDCCDAAFTQKLKLMQHMSRIHGKTKPIFKQNYNECSVCGALFLNIPNALAHAQSHSKETVDGSSTIKDITVFKVYACEFCETYFKSADTLNDHRVIHLDPSPYSCAVCGETFPTYTKMHIHKKCHDIVIEIESQLPIPIVYMCGLCKKEFKIWESLYVHRSRFHNWLNTVNATTEKRDYLGYLNCNVCGQTCGEKHELEKHKMKLHKAGEFRCEDCGKILAHLTGLIIHRRQHTGEKPFACDVCGKTFHQSAGMYTHRRTHTKEYPYRCELCNHGFNVKGDLNNHRRSKHTGERPFKCDICNKAFLTSGVYYQHKMLHQGIKKYKCQYCTGAFSRWNALRLHIRTHTGEKPHICDICGRGFAQKGDMRKHCRSQHGTNDKLFRCELCDRKFAQETDMIRHYLCHTMANESNKENVSLKNRL